MTASKTTSTKNAADRYSGYYPKVYGSNDSYLLINVLPIDLADEYLYKLRSEVKWGKMYQNGGKVPREIAIQGTISKDNFEPLY
ncbi:unnamed protein product, partial [Didymodactylos carnosus]